MSHFCWKFWPKLERRLWQCVKSITATEKSLVTTNRKLTYPTVSRGLRRISIEKYLCPLLPKLRYQRCRVTSTEGRRIEGLKGFKWGEVSQPTRESGRASWAPQWGPAQSPGRKRIFAYFEGSFCTCKLMLWVRQTVFHVTFGWGGKA